VQLCIVHQIRNSLRYVASKNKKEFTQDLKLVYQAVSKDAAELELDKLEKNGVKSILSSLTLREINGIIFPTISNIQQI